MNQPWQTTTVSQSRMLHEPQPAYGLSDLPQGRIPPVLSQANKQDLYVYGVGGLAAAASFTDRAPAAGAAIDDYGTALTHALATDRDDAFERRLLAAATAAVTASETRLNAAVTAAVTASETRITAAITESETRLRGDLQALEKQQQNFNAKLTNTTKRSFGLDELVEVPTLAKLTDGTLRVKPAAISLRSDNKRADRVQYLTSASFVLRQPANGLISVDIVNTLTRRQVGSWLAYYGKATSDDEQKDRLNLKIELGISGYRVMDTI